MILLRAILRHLLRHPWLTVLSIIGVALGVAVVTGVDLANESASRAFRVAAETVAGRATHQIVGGPAGIPEELYRSLRVDRGIRPVAPVVEGYVAVPGQPGTTLRIIGIDPFAEGPFRAFGARFIKGADLEGLLARPASGLLLGETAGRLGVKEGGILNVETGGIDHRLTVAGFLEAGEGVNRQGLEGVVVTDIATAQELLGMVGRLSRIDLILPEGGDARLTALRKSLPAGTEVMAAGARTGSLDQMTRAFRLNLTALSLLALMVGMFLIYNTTTFAVVRRRRLIGMLRAMGVTRREIFALICSEAILVGIVGMVLGLAGGMLLGRVLTGLVTRTINDLYFVLQLGEMVLSPLILAKGAILGIGATVAAALPPALEATTAPPRAVLVRSVIEARTRRLVPLAAIVGFLAMGGGCLLFLGDRGGIVTGFVGLFALILGYALVVPGATVCIAALVRPLAGGIAGPLGRMAARGVVTSLSRTGVATAALVVAVSATIGVGIMVGSFRSTVERWLESRLRADVYVTTVGTGTGREKPPLDPALVERLATVPGAAARSLTRRVTVEAAEGATDLLVMDVPQRSFFGLRLKEGDPERGWSSFSRGEAVIVSEPYAFRHRVGPGDRVRLRTDRGVREFPVAGVYYDYGSDTGVVAIARAAYLRHWDDRSVDGIGFYGDKGVTTDQLAEEIRKRAGASRITVISNRQLRDASVAVFDRTFAITGVLRLLTVVVAFVGVLSALMAIQVERSRELAVLRAVGLTPAEVWGLVCGETGLIGLIAGLLSLPLGILEALVLIHVINRRSFGWTMELSLEPAILLQAMVLACSAALIAGIWPAFAIARTSPALALREEE
ncbi:FtsX-like permease family protein [Geobacter sp.]|uniref:ABC transporter permease n=1 Tax=Geobacter sp. TaxID=46610 RepID=UPI0027B950EA|nr:FtsX-like permease family protein [Geobacter sp.]